MNQELEGNVRDRNTRTTKERVMHATISSISSETTTAAQEGLRNDVTNWVRAARRQRGENERHSLEDTEVNNENGERSSKKSTNEDTSSTTRRTKRRGAERYETIHKKHPRQRNLKKKTLTRRKRRSEQPNGPTSAQTYVIGFPIKKDIVWKRGLRKFS